MPCSRPTGTPGWAISPSSTTARDGSSTVAGVVESTRIQKNPRSKPLGGCRPVGAGRRLRSPRPRGVSCSWNTEAPQHTRAVGGPGARLRSSRGRGLRRHSATPLGCGAGSLSRRCQAQRTTRATARGKEGMLVPSLYVERPSICTQGSRMLSRAWRTGGLRPRTPTVGMRDRERSLNAR